MSKYEPCPFCGSKDTVNWHIPQLMHSWTKECFKCGARGPTADTEDECNEKWNKRVEA